jgi:hypothetical protein
MNHFFVNSNQEGNIEVSENGVNWRSVTKGELVDILNALKQSKDNAIIYSSENSLQEASSQAMEIFKIVESAKLPIKLVKTKGSDGSGESEVNSESNYANCLLVTLAKSPGAVAIIKSEQGVPNIENISKNQTELPWIRGLPFNYGRLNGGIVMNILLRIPSKKLGLFNKNRQITAKMVLSEGKAETVNFQIKESKSKDGIQQIEVNRIIG